MFLLSNSDFAFISLQYGAFKAYQTRSVSGLFSDVIIEDLRLNYYVKGHTLGSLVSNERVGHQAVMA